MHSTFARRAISLLVASVICISTLSSVATPVSAASEATLMDGPTLRNVLWGIAGGGDRALKTFQKGTNPPSNAIAIDENETGSVKAWATSGNVYWYSSANKVYLNSDSSALFDSSKGVTKIDMTGLDTSRVTTMYKMFQTCLNLTSLDIRGFNTSGVTDMTSMFAGCRNLESIDVSSFDTHNVLLFNNMFNGCRKITEMDLNSFDTSAASGFGSMFKECCKLQTIYLGRNFVTTNADNYTGMFSTKYNGETNLTTIYAYNDFKEVLYMGGIDGGTNASEMYLFDGCTKLTGGAGTKYSNYTATNDYNYFKSARFAKIDGGPNHPGYFTMPSTSHTHVWDEPFYEWNETGLPSSVTGSSECKLCGEWLIETVGVDHVNTIQEKTCTADGIYEYVAKDFESSILTRQTKTITDPSTGHNYGSPKYTYDSGTKECVATVTCSKCNDKITKTAAPNYVGSTDATCLAAGSVTYSYTFSDPHFTTQTKTFENGQALGHNWGAVVYTWSSDYSTCTATRTCTRDSSHKESKTVSTTYNTTKFATCTEKGQNVYTANFNDSVFGKKTKTVDIPALGHDWNDVVYEWSDNYSTCTAYRTCTRNTYHEERETVTAVHTGADSTCYSAGYDIYTASFTNPAFKTQTQRFDYPKVNHKGAAAVRENELSATCENNGSYDSVVYCQYCHSKMSSSHVTIPATGHNWGEVTYAWSNDYSKVTARRVCANDSSHVETEVANTTYTTTASTCTDTGSTTYVAEFNNPAFITQTKTIPGGGSASHLWGEVTYSWSSDNKTVTATRVCSRDSSHVETETVNTVSAVTTQATCKNKGKTTYTATFTNAAFVPQTKTLENIPMLPHTYGAVSYEKVENGTKLMAMHNCTKCGADYHEIRPISSSVTKQATCTEKGETTYTAVFDKEAFGTWTETLANIPALDHSWGSEQEENIVNPTCENAGHKDKVVYCTRCQVEKYRNRVTLAALGHNWGPQTTEWEEGNYSWCRATRICLNDSSHKITEKVNTTHSVYIQPTCTEEGVTNYYADFTNPLLEDRSIGFWDIAPLGHDWDKVTYTWSTDYSSVTARRVCKRNTSHVETETCTDINCEIINATCTEAGKTVYTSGSFSNSAFKPQTKEITIPALSHLPSEAVRENIVPSTCIQNGSCDEVVYCSRCHQKISSKKITLPLADHTPGEPAEENRVEATYDSAGHYDRVVRCTVCNAVISSTRVEIPALNHVWGEPTYQWSGYSSCKATIKDQHGYTITKYGKITSAVTTEATCTMDGVRTYTAVFDTDVFTTQTKPQTIKALGHNAGDPVEENVVPATCETEGHADVVVYCTRCGEQISRVTGYVEAYGHSWNSATYTWNSDKTKVTATRVCQHDSSHKQTETVNVTAKTTDATCTKAGKIVYTSASFNNPAFNVQTDTVSIPAKGHKEGAAVRENEVAATCRRSGYYDEVVYCSVCHEEISRTPVYVDKLPHTPGTPHRENEVPATYEETGHYDWVTRCTVCLEALESIYYEIPMKGHQWGKPEYSWSNDYKTITAVVHCVEPGCDEVFSETANVISEVTTESSCGAEGVMTYTAVFQSDLFKKQTKTVTIPKTAHRWDKPTYDWSDDLKTVTAIRICTHNVKHIETETVKTTSAVTKPATLTSTGIMTYTTQTFKNGAFKVQTKKVDIPKLTATPAPKATSKPKATATPTAKPSAKPTAKPTVASSSNVTLTLDKSKANVICGKTLTLKATLKGASSKITWKSSDTKVATVDSSGKITGKMAGVINISATAAGKTASCRVTVLYKDVTNSSDFWYEPTYYLTEKNVVKGYDNQTLFKPSNECTRAQMVTFIWRLSGEPDPKAKTCKFSDVKKSDYFYKACIWGNENHIVEGYKDGTFGPQIVCARKHAVTFLWRLAKQPEPKAKSNKFKDVKTSDYFYKATLWASEMKILAGYADGTFKPDGDCLRRQMVTFLYKYDKYVNGKG